MCKEIYAYIVCIYYKCVFNVCIWQEVFKDLEDGGALFMYILTLVGMIAFLELAHMIAAWMRTWCVSYWLAMFGCEFSATIFGWSYFWFSAGELFVFQDNVLLNLRLTIKGCYVFFRDSVDLSVLFCTNLGAKIGRSASITAKPKILAKDEKTKWMEKMIIQKVPNPRKLYKTTLKSLKDFEPSKPKAEAKVHFWMTKATVEIIWIQQSMPFPSAVFIQAWYELVADETVDPVALNSLIHAFVKARCDVVMWVVSVPQDRNQPQKAYCNNHLISHAQAVRWQRHALVVFGTESLHLPCKGLFFSTHVWDELPLNYPSYRFYRSCFQIVFWNTSVTAKTSNWFKLQSPLCDTHTQFTWFYMHAAWWSMMIHVFPQICSFFSAVHTFVISRSVSFSAHFIGQRRTWKDWKTRHLVI